MYILLHLFKKEQTVMNIFFVYCKIYVLISSRESLEQKEGDITRREFLQGSAVGFGALAFGTKMERLDRSDDTFAKAAQSYIADSHEQATKISEYIKQEKGSSPSNICGPLATSILLGWKLNEEGTVSNISKNINNSSRMEGITPREMWLGTPESDPSRFLMAFPSNQYDAYHVRESIGSVDFDNIPGVKTLKVGDFLYLDGGSFTHYLAISRRDSEGRLYSVSNVHGEKLDEFKIQEVMLWDPNTKNGFLRDWAKGVGPERARTGLKGFYLWRRKEDAEYIAESEPAQKLRDTLLNKMREQKGGDWNVYINEIGKGELFEWRNGIPYHSASTIKVPLSILALDVIKERYKDEISRDGLEATLKNRGYEGRTFNQLLSAMLVNSEELATENLASFTKSGMSLSEGFRELGLQSTTYEPRRSTQKDMFKCWKTLFMGKYLDIDSTRYILGKLAEYTGNDDTLIGEVRKEFPNARQWNKRGTITDEITTVQDTGIIQIPTVEGGRYIYIGIAGTSKTNKRIKYEEMRVFISSIMEDITKYIKESSPTPFERKTPTKFPQ
jgi:hypothetical protein